MKNPSHIRLVFATNKENAYRKQSVMHVHRDWHSHCTLKTRRIHHPGTNEITCRLSKLVR